DEAGQVAEHARRRRTGLVQQRLSGIQGAAGEVGLGGDGREAVALDGEAEQGDAWAGHGGVSIISVAPARRATGAAIGPECARRRGCGSNAEALWLGNWV